MIRLINIKRKENCIECDYCPENEQKFGHLIVDLNSSNVSYDDIKWTSGLKYKMHINMARNRLIKIANDNPLPKEQLVMWY